MNELLEIRPEDHRLRSARRKRERMRAHLLQSVLAVYPGEDPCLPAVIDDVIRHAEVSRGTFYKYFGSLDEAVDELAAQLAQELVWSCSHMYENLNDARLRAATGFQMFLSRAVVDPHWASFASHLGNLARDTGVLQLLSKNLLDGRDAGIFRFRDASVTIDLVVGTVVEGIRRSMQTPATRHYVETLSSMVLLALGVAADEADRIAADASARLHREAPARLSWWRPYD